jgi:hypothetical protein
LIDFAFLRRGFFVCAPAVYAAQRRRDTSLVVDLFADVTTEHISPPPAVYHFDFCRAISEAVDCLMGAAFSGLPDARPRSSALRMPPRRIYRSLSRPPPVRYR